MANAAQSHSQNIPASYANSKFAEKGTSRTLVTGTNASNVVFALLGITALCLAVVGIFSASFYLSMLTPAFLIIGLAFILKSIA